MNHAPLHSASLPLLLTALGLMACGSDPTSGTGGLGNIEISTSTSGTHPDGDGYTVRLDGQLSQNVGINDVVSFNNLEAGNHSVRLAGAADHCTIAGSNPRTVNVRVGQTVRTTFTIACNHSPTTLEVLTSTVGTTTDADGYMLLLDGGARTLPIGVNDRVTFDNVEVGTHTLELVGLAAECSTSNNPRSLSVGPNGLNGVVFTVVCTTPPPSILSITPASGPHASIVTIRGADLSTESFNGSKSIVLLSGTPAGNVISEKPHEIIVQMPTYEGSQTWSVVVEANGLQSQPLTWDQTDIFGPTDCSGVCDGGMQGVIPIPISIPYDFLARFQMVDRLQAFSFSVSRDVELWMWLDWTADMPDAADMWVTDDALSGIVCSDGATGNRPELSNCQLAGPGDYVLWYSTSVSSTFPLVLSGHGHVQDLP